MYWCLKACIAVGRKHFLMCNQRVSRSCKYVMTGQFKTNRHQTVTHNSSDMYCGKIKDNKQK